MSEARLTVLAGPTAVGKGTVSADIRRRYPQVWLSVSATTRPPRPGEVDGIHYFFVSPERFDELVASGDMLEWAVVHGRNRYGTPRRAVEEHLATGTPVLLEIDLQGARQVKESMPDARFVFLAPPSWTSLSTASSAGGPRARRSRSAGSPPPGSSSPPRTSSTSSSSTTTSAAPRTSSASLMLGD